MQLTGAQAGELTEAMAKAFTFAELTQLVRFKIGGEKELAHFVDTKQGLTYVLSDLIEASRREGWTEALVEAVYGARSGHPLVRAFVETHCPEMQIPRDPMRHVDAVRAGLQALTDIVRRLADPTIRMIIGQFRADFAITHQKIETLGQYKGLHDQLHQVNAKYLRPMTSAAALRQDETHRQLLESYVLQLLGDVARIRGPAQRLRSYRIEQRWIEALEQAGRLMQQGLNEETDDNVQKGLGTLRRVLSEQPARINELIWTTAGDLRLEQIIEAMQQIAERLHAVPIGTADADAAGARDAPRNGAAGGLPVSQFEAGLSGMVLLWPRLSGLVEEHAEWQLLDKELAAADTVQEIVPERRFPRWDEFRARLLTLCGLSPEEEWAKSLTALLQDLQQAGAAQNAVQFGRHYNKFRTVAADRFFNVDAELLDLSDQLADLGEPLDHLLRIVTDGSN